MKKSCSTFFCYEVNLCGAVGVVYLWFAEKVFLLLQKPKIKSILIHKLLITSPYYPLPIPYSLDYNSYSFCLG